MKKLSLRLLRFAVLKTTDLHHFQLINFFHPQTTNPRLYPVKSPIYHRDNNRIYDQFILLKFKQNKA